MTLCVICQDKYFDNGVCRVYIKSMIYPVIVHKDEASAYGVTLVDFPGCFSAGDTIEEALGNVQEAVELYMEGEDMELPSPSAFEAVAGSDEAKGGAIAMVDIDPSFLDKRVTRINITVPRYALARIDRAAKAKGLSRSRFLVDSVMQRVG